MRLRSFITRTSESRAEQKALTLVPASISVPGVGALPDALETRKAKNTAAKLPAKAQIPIAAVWEKILDKFKKRPKPGNPPILTARAAPRAAPEEEPSM
jgi:hypothetical protein